MDRRDEGGDANGDDRLAVEADLDVTVEGHEVRVAGYGALVVVEAPSLRAARALRRGLDAVPRPPARIVESAPSVDVRVRGVSVARIDPDTDPGMLARLLGTAPARPSLGGVVRALLRR